MVSGSAAVLFVESAEFFFVATDVGCDCFEGVAELIDLGGKAGEGVWACRACWRCSSTIARSSGRR